MSSTRPPLRVLARKTSEEPPTSLSRALICPQCRKGHLQHFQTIEVVQDVLSIPLDGCANLGPIEGSEGLDCYIGCTYCDFLGSGADVLRLMPAVPSEPRYIGYQITPIAGSGDYTLFGVFESQTWERIADFEDEALAFAMLYRITGIPGNPGQTYYPLTDELEAEVETVH